MYIEEVAKLLDGKEYRHEVDKELRDKLRRENYLVIYGASDDIMCIDGIFEDETYDTIYLKDGEILVNDCANEDCPHFEKAIKSAWSIEPIFHDSGETTWTYSTLLPHATFNIMEDDEIYCIGLVIDMDDTYNAVS